MSLETCCGCGVRLPPIEGPVHRYLESSPSCWAAYGKVLAREYSDPALMPLHRLSVDAYAVQHPGQPSPQSIRSVAIHLISLHVVLELGMTPAAATEFIGKRLKTMEFEWMTPPAGRCAVTVADLLEAEESAFHLEAVPKWAKAAWDHWSLHHAQVRAWAAKALKSA